MDKPWYLTPSALSIIADIRDNPPRREVHVKWFGPNCDEWQTFEGPHAEALSQVRHAISEPLLSACDARGDHTEYRAVMAGSVDDVIAAVTGTWLPGTHFCDDKPRLAEIADALAMEFAA